MLKIEIEQAGANVCVKCQGVLLWGADLERLPELARNARGQRLVLDLKRVRRIDAHGVGTVAAMAGIIRQHGSELRIVHVPAHVRDVFHTCGLESLLDSGTEACSSAA